MLAKQGLKSRNRHHTISTVTAILFVVCCCVGLSAGEKLSLAWDPNAEPDIQGYRLYWGIASRQYSNTLVVGKVTTATISNLTSSTTYFLAATAVNTLGLESDFSAEVQYTTTGSNTPQNSPPVIASIPDKTIAERATLNFTVSATDADRPAQALTYSMLPGAPAGAVFNPATATFSWTPTEAQGPSTNTLTFKVTDSLGASATRSVRIVATEVNTAPVLAAIPDQTVAEGTLINFDLSATDADRPAQTLTYSLEPGAPAGATFDAATATFSWTPTEAQGPSTNVLTFKVTDSLGASATRSVLIVVTEVNTKPALVSVAAKTVAEGATLSFTLRGTDADLPPQALTYSMQSSLPAGATFNAATATFSWTPTEAQGPSTNVLSFRVTDSLGAYASRSVTVKVTEANATPVLEALPDQTIAAGVTLSFTVNATDADLPAQTLTYSMEPGAPTGATFDAATATFSWTPTEAQSPSTNIVEFSVVDSLGATDSIVVIVSVVPNANTAPTGISRLVTATRGVKTLARLYGYDAEGDQLQYIIVTSPTNGTLSGTPPMVYYTSSPEALGLDRFTFKVNDGQVDGTPVTMFMDVRVPVATASATVMPGTTLHLVSRTNTDSAGLGTEPEIATQPSAARMAAIGEVGLPTTATESGLSGLENPLNGPGGILTPARAGLARTSVMLSFTSETHSNYRVEKTFSLAEEAWTTWRDNVPGTGLTIELTDRLFPGQKEVYYRVLRTQPSDGNGKTAAR